MWHIAVAVPAGFAFTNVGHHEVNLTRLYQFGVQLGMATYAVVHYHLRRCRLSLWHLTLVAGDEGQYMLHAVGTLEEIFSGNVFVRHVAVVARCVTSV